MGAHRIILSLPGATLGLLPAAPSLQNNWLQNQLIFETIHGTTERPPARRGTPSGFRLGGHGFLSALRDSFFRFRAEGARR